MLSWVTDSGGDFGVKHYDNDEQNRCDCTADFPFSHDFNFFFYKWNSPDFELLHFKLKVKL